MALKFSNFGKATIGSAPVGTTGLSFTVEAGTGLLFPSLGAGDYFYGIFKDASGNREVVKVEARSTDAMTIAVGGRGLDGTTARTWAAGDYFVAGLLSVALQESLANANLIALGALPSAADKLPYFTGAGAAALTGLSAFIRTLLDDVDGAAARATLGAVGLTVNETITGDKTFSGKIAMQNKAVLFSEVTVAAHATTANIWGANRTILSGAAVTFTDFADAPQIGAWVELYCNAAHVFTHNANLIIDGGATYTATPGDRILVRARDPGNVFELHLLRVAPVATPTYGGTIQQASQSEARAAVNTTKAVTPAGLDWPRSFGLNGYQQLPGTPALIIQWGRTANHGDLPSGQQSNTVAFPIAFPNYILNAVICPAVNGVAGGAVTAAWDFGSTTLSVLHWDYEEFTARTQSNTYFTFFAVGY